LLGIHAESSSLREYILKQCWRGGLRGEVLLKLWFRWPRRHLPVFALVCCGILVSALSFLALRSLETEKAKAAFDRAAHERFDDLQSDLDSAVNKVVAVGAFCESSYPVTRPAFDTFVVPLFLGRDAGIRALEWIPRVSLGERAAFEKSVRAGGLPGFEIRDRQEQGRMVRSGDRLEYFPVLYIQPYVGNELALGYDVLASSSRREALMRAESSGELTATERITLVQETSSQYGILIVRPVYRHAGGSFEGKQLQGFALGVLQTGTVVEEHGAMSGVDIALTDLSAGPAKQQLYPFAGKRPQPASAFTQYRTISVGGRNWQFAASPMPGAFPVSKTYSYAGGTLCLLFTLLFAVCMMDSLDRRWQVEQVVEERTSALNAAIHSLAQVHSGLEESEARYRGLVEDSPNGIVVERQGKIVLVNRAAMEMFDFDAIQDSEDHRLVDFVIPERRESAKRIIQELYAREMQIASQETCVLRHDGSIVDVEVAASSFLHAGLQNIQVILRDVSQRKLAEAVNARLIRAIEQVGESIVITDLNANIVYVNPAFERISGYSREESLGQNPRLLKSGRHCKEFYTALWDTLKAGESWSGQFINRAKNGRLYTEEATISPVVNRSGEVINYVAVKRDVTLETELQEQLHQSQKMDAIGRLAGGVAHDFNNMLMVIVSYADLLASSLPDHDPGRKHIDQILSAARRSTALTRQLLAFSRKQVLAPHILDCNAILLETSSMVSRLISENIDLKCDLAPDLWRVKADADQIVQVILNLCVNSRDAMPDGGSLVLATRNYHVDQGFVELSVSDTGVGIPLELQEKLFEPFFTTKERSKGTGLGLATVYGIVQQSGGYIRVDSSSGRGATFSVFLPRCLEAVPSSESPIQKTFLTGRSLVLVVEDESALREAIADCLRNHSYQVLAAADGIEALDILAQHPEISILISDLIMPRMGGRELVRLATEKIPNLHVIFMSGYADQAFRAEDLAEFPTAFLQKPFAMNVLLARIAELTQRPDAVSSQ
jgi:two-component system, cell cycle sensor histidine kinase and response regulator CckA